MTNLEIHDPSPSGTPPSATPQRAIRPALFYLIALIVFASDQFSKGWVQRYLSWETSKSIVGNVFSLTLTQNPGGAWGVLPKGNPIFSIFAAAAVVALLIAYNRMPRVPLLVGSALALALGGALGNLLDRLRYGYVVDFFDVHLQRFHWPIFNVADSAITLGIILLLIHFLRAAGTEAEEEAHSAAHSQPPKSTVALAAEEAGAPQSEA
jgi:signal peptidase II